MLRRLMILTAVIGALAAAPLLAQGGKNGRKLNRAIDEVQHGLNLRPDQTSRLRSLLETREAELQALNQKFNSESVRALRAQPGATKADRKNAKQTLQSVRSDRQAIQERFLTGFKGMLLPEQLNAYDGMINAANQTAAIRTLRLSELEEKRKKK